MQCPVCFLDIECMQAAYECGHILCIMCAARLIYLMNDEKCPLCLKSNQHILFRNCFEESAANVCSTKESKGNGNVHTGWATCSGSKDTGAPSTSVHAVCKESLEKSLNVLSIRTRSRPMQSERKNVFFATPDMCKEIRRVLAFACQLCTATFPSLQPLRTHYNKSHKKLLCDECMGHRKSFPSEFELFDHRSLKEHKSSGDGSFRGHVWCCFCSSYFYNAETARAHCIEHHELCVFCEEKRFYKDFECLETHWKRMHYTCKYPTCIKQKAYAFKYKGELMQHLLKYHNVGESRIESRVEEDLPFMDPMAKEVTWGGHQKENSQHTSTLLKTSHRSKASTENTAFARPRPVPLSKSKEVRSEGCAFPSFLDRSSMLADRSQRQVRMQLLKRSTPHFEVVDGLLDKMNSNVLDPKHLISEMEVFMAPRDVHKLLNTVIGFVHDRKTLASVLKTYKNQIDFPKYKSKAPRKDMAKEVTKLGYKVFDFTKK
eukprot:jgi/Antlo1/428/1758